jgi:hypothetical protein
MGTRSFSRLLAVPALLLVIALIPRTIAAQEIPLKHCDTLPVIEVAVGDQTMVFLVDTAATSFRISNRLRKEP